MRQNVFKQLEIDTRLKIIRQLLAAYHDYVDADCVSDREGRARALELGARGVRILIARHSAWPAPKIVYVRQPHGLGRDYGQADKRRIYIYLPTAWKTKTGRGRFAQAIEWAKTVVHEVMHYIVNRHEEKLVREYELDFVDDMTFTGKEIADGKPLDNAQ